VKKYYPLLALVAIAWVFSSCGGSDNPAPTGSVTPVPSVQTSETSTTSTSTTPSKTPRSTSSAQPTPEVSPTNTTATTDPSSALAVAQALQVRGRAADTNYSRDAFGSAWKDVDRNGCDTRNDILQRDFTTVVLKPGTGDCKVIGGTWTDPYSNESYTFTEAPSGAQVDHVVALKNAWQMGADLWNDQMRVEFANDPLNLRVTIASLNQQKSDSNAASWLPPYKPGRCFFIATQVAVKAKWELYVTTSEKEVFVAILSKPECAETRLPR
jgi:hypothetical protein